MASLETSVVQEDRVHWCQLHKDGYLGLAGMLCHVLGMRTPARPAHRAMGMINSGGEAPSAAPGTGSRCSHGFSHLMLLQP
jgi:hypothetical protein